jgi:hypothetical protein
MMAITIPDPINRVSSEVEGHVVFAGGQVAYPAQ